MPVSLPSFLLLSLALVTAQGEPQAAPNWEPSLLVQLQVTDLNRSIAFYEGKLGFKITERRDDLAFAHVDCGVAGLQLGLSAGGAKLPDPGTVVLNFGIRGDIEVARKALEAKGIAFKGPTTVIPGKVRLAEFTDPDGYRIRLAGSDPIGR
jgi:predicted enzyme related to lactoylglutathione lyase